MEQNFAFSVTEDALERSAALQRAAKRDGIICPLGYEEYDWFVYNILCVAGITVDLVSLHQEELGFLYSAVQIVDKVDLEMRMEEVVHADTANAIKMCEGKEMLGLQVKLNPSHKWKVNVVPHVV